MYTYAALEQTIAQQLNTVRILPARQSRVDAIAKHLLSFKDQYVAVQVATGVPAVVVAAIHERESDADFNTYLGNGDPLDKPSVHVPRGRGGFKTWSAGAADALTLDRLNQVNDWSWERAIYEWTLYNGFGPLSHGHQSGYVWAGTSVYDGGKYVRDGVWDPSIWDSQLGCYPIAYAMVNLDASLVLPRAVATPVPEASPLPAPSIAIDTPWLQGALNKLGAHPQLTVDGSYGRMTKHAVEDFQDRAGITIDGQAGPETVAAINAALAKLGVGT